MALKLLCINEVYFFPYLPKRRNLTAVLLILIPEYDQSNATYFFFYVAGNDHICIATFGGYYSGTLWYCLGVNTFQLQHICGLFAAVWYSS